MADMTKDEYEQLRPRAAEILALIHAFPAHEMMAYEDKNGMRDSGPGTIMWLLHRELFLSTPLEELWNR